MKIERDARRKTENCAVGNGSKMFIREFKHKGLAKTFTVTQLWPRQWARPIVPVIQYMMEVIILDKSFSITCNE